MRAREESGLIFAKLDDGEDLFGCIEQLTRDLGLNSALIISNIGMLRDIEINFFKDGTYSSKQFSEPMELVAMHGSIAVDGSIHIHCALAGEDHVVVGGHLTRATVAVLNELIIRRLDDIKIERIYNERTNLKETAIE